MRPNTDNNNYTGSPNKPLLANATRSSHDGYPLGFWRVADQPPVEAAGANRHASASSSSKEIVIWDVEIGTSAPTSL